MLFQMGLVQGYQCDKEYRVIKVASRFNKSCTPSEPITECKTLQDVVTNIKSLNETCIEIYNNQNLTESIRFKYVSGLTLLKASNISEVVVDCNTDTRCGQNGTGISFRNSSNIKIYGLKFERCGIKQKTDLCAEKQNLVFYISSAFRFDYITNVTFEGVQLFKSHGYSVHMFNSGSQLRFHKVTVKDGIFVRNCYSDCHAEVIGSRSGGGIQIVFGGSSAFSRENQVEISSSNFQTNIAELNDRNFSCKGYFPFGRGGALSIIFNGDSKNNDVVVTNSSFTNNSALWGGSIHFKFDDHSQYNNVQVKSVSIDSSKASLYGGGILAWGVNNESNNNFNVSETNFYGNHASLGGGLAIMGLKGQGKYATVMNCSFEDNAASFGAGIFIKDTKATLDTVSVSQNNNKSTEVYSQTSNGAIASFNSTVNVHGNSFIEKNINTGFLLDQTKLDIKGHLSLSKNNGFDGGGMAVYGNSYIKTYKNSTLYFANNKASNRGGGLFVMVPGPYIKPLNNIMLSRYDCFIKNNNGAVDGNISFVNNTASNEYGKAIFVSTLQHCTRGMNDFETVFTNWTNFYFRPDNDSHNVVTEPSTMKLNMDEWTPAPGIPFQPSVFLYDERGTNVAETVDVTLEPENITTSTLNKKFVIDDNKINIAFKGNKSINFSAVIVATNSEVLPHNITNITFKECPFGFYYNDQDQLCQCGRPHDFSKGIAQCAQSDIYVFKNRWVYINASYECPSGYCIDCQNDTITGFECKLNILKQCNEARRQTSRLCSRCMDGYSVTIGSNMCSPCKGGHSWWPLIIFAYLIIFITATILFLVCNFNGYACYLNSAVFFYKCAGTVMEPVKVYYIDPAMTLWLTLLSETFESREVGFCFIDGLNNLDKLGFTFGKPGLFILPIVIVIVVLKCTNKGWKFFNMDICKRSINNILIIFWMGIIIAILQTLHPVSIDGTKYVFVYADEVYLGKNHRPYFAMAVVMIIAAAVFLICTLFYEKFYSHLIGRFRIVVYILSFLIYAIICIYVPTDIRVTLASIFCLIMVSVILLLPTNDNSEEDDDRQQLIQSNENNRNEKLLNGLELTHLSMLTLLVLLYGSMEGLYCPSIAEKKIAHPCRIISISINILLYLPLATSAFYCVYNLYLKHKIAAIRKRRKDATDGAHDDSINNYPARVREVDTSGNQAVVI